MSHLEIIHLRSSGQPLAALGQQIRESLGREGERAEVTLYRRHGLETDVAVHIRRTETSDGTSRLGLRLAAALRDFGLVEHATWEELATTHEGGGAPLPIG